MNDRRGSYERHFVFGLLCETTVRCTARASLYELSSKCELAMAILEAPASVRPARQLLAVAEAKSLGAKF